MSNLHKIIGRGRIQYSTNPISRYLTEDERKYYDRELVVWVDEKVSTLAIQRLGSGHYALDAARKLRALEKMTLDNIYFSAAKAAKYEVTL